MGLCIALKLMPGVDAMEVDYQLAPSRIDLMIKPAQMVTMSFKITNYGDPHTFTPRFMNAAPDSGSGTLALSKSVKTPVTFTFPNGRRDTGDPIFLKTDESATVPVTIETSAGEQKDYYYYFLAEVQPGGIREGKTSIQLSPRIGVPVVITLTNAAEREAWGLISVFNVKPDYSFRLFGKEINLVEWGSRVPVILSVSNTGSSFISPQGKIAVRGAFGVTAEHPVIRRNVYAQSARLMLTQSSFDRTCYGQDECRRSTLVLGGFLFGKYTLAASMDLGADAAKSFKTVSFIAFPFKPVLTLVLFIILYIVLLRRRKPSHKKKT